MIIEELKKMDENYNEEMVEISNEIFNKLYGNKNKVGRTYSEYKYIFKKFFKNFLTLNPKNVEWNYICDIAINTKKYKYSLLLITILLNKNLYNGKYSKYLYEKKNIFNSILNQQSFSKFKNVFCKDDIQFLEIYPKTLKHDCYKFHCYFFRYKNPKIKKYVLEILSSPRKYNTYFFQEIIDLFEDSLGKYAPKIFSYKDFNELTFWKQINFFKLYYKDDDDKKSKSINSIIWFYKYLVNTYTEHSFFKNATTMNETLLFSNNTLKKINDGYIFLTFNPNIKIKFHKKIVFILKNCNHLSTTLKKEDSISINLSNLECYFYSKELLNYIISSNTIIIRLSHSGHLKYLIDSLNFLYKLKKEKNYPNPNLEYINNQEAIFLRNYCNISEKTLHTKNTKIGAIRRFLQWEMNLGNIKFDNMVFDYLSQFEEPSKTGGNAIPEEDLIAINNCFFRDSKIDFVAKLCYCVFHLLLETEFRVSQILSLEINCLKKSIKPNQYYIYSNTKTSNGKVKRQIITDLTYRHLIKIINETEEIREKCSVKSKKDYIFIHEGSANSLLILNNSTINSYLEKYCKELNLEQIYTVKNIRDTHMTKSFEYILRNKKSDLELTCLTKHKYIDTTKNHYVQMQLEKMLESTYGIIIGDLENLLDSQNDIKNNIKKEIPKEVDISENIVENGCGNCKADLCVVTTSVPCLICKNFITTPKHEKYFIKAIENIDKLIDKDNNTKHDKEDLTIIKTLYILYLKKIYEFMEENVNND